MRARSAFITSLPPTPAPNQVCPQCDIPLVYRKTAYNGVTPVERWDYYQCAKCGLFEYRERTRRLRRTDDLP